MADTRETKNRERTRSYGGGPAHGGSTYPRTERGTPAARQTGTSISASNTTPFSMMRRMLEDMDRMFFDFGGTPLSGSWSGDVGGGTIWAPEIETFRRNDQLVVRADLPGMTRENVNVELEDDTLLISGERRDEYKEERDDFYRSERSYGRFFRAVPLPEGVDPNSARAEFKDGVLEVTVPLPRETERQSRRIEIK